MWTMDIFTNLRMYKLPAVIIYVRATDYKATYYDQPPRLASSGPILSAIIARDDRGETSLPHRATYWEPP